MGRKAGQLISRGSRTWLVGVSCGRNPETGALKYHNKTIRGSFRTKRPKRQGPNSKPDIHLDSGRRGQGVN